MNIGIAQYKITGSVTLQGNALTDPEFWCDPLKNPIGDTYAMEIHIVTENPVLKLSYTQTVGYVDNEAILTSITELSTATKINYPIPPNS